MIQLTSTSDVIEITTDANSVVTTHASWMDANNLSVVPGRQDTNVATATQTTIVSSPPVNTARDLKTLVINNAGPTSVNILVEHNDGVSDCALLECNLDAYATMMWLPKTGWALISSQGFRSAAMA